MSAKIDPLRAARSCAGAAGNMGSALVAVCPTTTKILISYYLPQNAFIEEINSDETSAEAFISGGKKGVMIAEPCTIQGMEFDSCLVFQHMLSNGRLKAYLSPLHFSPINCYLRAKFKLALINIILPEIELDIEATEDIEKGLQKSAIMQVF